MTVVGIVATFVQLAPGTYYGGYAGSIMIPPSLVIERLTKEGFRNFSFGMRDVDDFPAGVDPKSDPRYQDSWDGWVQADYVGLPRTMDRPADLSWLVFQPLTVPVVSVPNTPAPAARTTNQTPWWVWALGAYLLLRR